MDKLEQPTTFSTHLIATATAIIWWRRTKELKIGMECPNKIPNKIVKTANFRASFDTEDLATAAKTIPSFIYRVINPSLVTISPNDRAQQVRFSFT